MKKSREVFGLNFSLLNENEISNLVVSEIPDPNEFRLLVTTNTDHVVNMSKFIEFEDACKGAWLVTADGFPVAAVLKFLGVDISGRITGADLFPAIINSLDPKEHRPFFVCSTEKTAKFFIDFLEENNFLLSSDCVYVPEFGFEMNENKTNDLINKIIKSKTTHLFFGVGSPKSELWMSRHQDKLKGLYGFGFGAGLDFFSGTAKRAPAWMQKYCMEWLWRLASDPKRMFKRYLINSWSFLYIAFSEIKRFRSARNEYK